MNDYGRRVNSIIIKNLPTNYNESQLEELFSKFGRIVSSKVLPSNPNFDGGCGFVNYAEPDSCNKAVETMNNFVIDRFTLRVNHSSTRLGNNNDRPQNGFRSNGELHENNNGTSSPGIQNRFSGFRPASERSPTNTIRLKTNTTPLNTNESDAPLNNNKPLWNSTNIEQQNDKNLLRNEPIMNIREHDLFILNKSYCVYLSNLEVPNIIFAATLDDYVNATLLITQMNKHEQLTKIQANSYKSKLVVGQFCAALFNGDWYRARILEVDENRVHVQYIDWGNTGWCDSILEIRPLPNEYYKDAVLCVKCVLDEIPTENKPTDEQTNAILEILVLDVKLEMTVLRIENGIPYVQLNLGKRDLNAEIRAILPQSLSSSSSTTTIVSENVDNEIINFDLNKPEMNISEVHSVQLTTVDAESECFHVLLMRDCLPTIMNILRDWNANKQPLTKQPKPNMLVCAQYEGDDLWYRAWIENVSEIGFRVYFVDFGNEEIVSMDRLSECPDILRNMPWQSVQIKLANIKLTDEERYILLRDFETARLDMKILSKNQDIYSVELISNEKSLSEYIFELRQNKEQQTQITPITNEVLKEPVESIQESVSKMVTPPPPMTDENISQTFNENVRSISLPVQPIVNEPQRFAETNQSDILPSPPLPSAATVTTSTNSPSTLNIETKTLSTNELNSDSNFNDNLTTMLIEQRRQNRLLEQVIAAINTTNALLTQLVQHQVANRAFSSVKNVISNNKEVIVLGHRNPDTDAITAAIVYSDFLRRMNINAKAYRLGDLNNETKFILKTVDIKEPEMLPDDISNGTEVALVDHNESQQSMKNLKKMRVTHVIDHHKLGDLTSSEPIYLRIEPVGCTATILTKLYRENNLNIDQKMAFLLISAILSDTLHFRSPTTTNDDRKMLEYLIPLAKINDIKSYANQMFEAKSDLNGFSSKQILLLDYKTYSFNNETWGIGTGETCSMNKMLERKDDLLKEMREEKKRNNLKGILYSIIDIVKEKNLTLIPDDIEEKVVRQAFKVDAKHHIADLGSRVSRKKQIVPVLEEYFHQQS
ncbi:unnamed protein product [Rotaria sp. Silwood2]|nr:unnamed protein product [Rotaria sp. Silwood2]CAF2971906.1 unnamed protein product [Rotaria sp. Silwood2]CAF3269769.1 unnamed protein product [Rotaria sp. Silwood2]CAF4013220.1 unnamed protein product [Rotaria sp. Silwood2]CAF4282018.1 unnamed protein product [Rotaria sp. Silwood2]